MTAEMCSVRVPVSRGRTERDECFWFPGVVWLLLQVPIVTDLIRFLHLDGWILRFRFRFRFGSGGMFPFQAGWGGFANFRYVIFNFPGPYTP